MSSDSNSSIGADDQHRVGRLGLLATIFFGCCLIAFAVMLVRGAQAPKLHSSHALIKALVEPKPLMKHMQKPEVIELVRAFQESETVTLPALSRQLNLKPVSGGDGIELRASGSTPEQAQALLEAWLKISRDMWPESVQETRPLYGPFLIVARSSPEPRQP